ncbi:putative viral transcription factor [Bodo saltans virus]|uniref:Viral transcription factor n=1 Tax=Bodo saltans virus TaxID=2024608 RepID=A0A2H4UU25_9VIRU|nr:putative viral transcription factor [Bodo saltans virus]ATZ80441.1 putative viral transcription factor [Bodo saltans virus]
MPKKNAKKVNSENDDFLDEFIEIGKKNNNAPIFMNNTKNKNDEKHVYDNDNDNFIDDENIDNENIGVENNDVKKLEINTNDLQNIIKRRGRPRKLTSPRQVVKAVKQNKLTTQELDSIQESNSIILHLGKYSDDEIKDETSEKNESHTDANCYDDELKIVSSETNKNKKNTLIMCLSDEDITEDDNYLRQELNKKNAEIKRLKNELNAKSENFTDMHICNRQHQNHNLFEIKTIYFDSNKPTPNKSEFACWNCTYNFDNAPCFIPEKYQAGVYYVFGNFCRDECSLSYILKDDEHKITMRRSLLVKMHREKYGPSRTLRPAFPKEILEKFGGPKTIQQYREETTDYKEYKLKLSIIPCFLEEFCRD